MNSSKIALHRCRLLYLFSIATLVFQVRAKKCNFVCEEDFDVKEYCEDECEGSDSHCEDSPDLCCQDDYGPEGDEPSCCLAPKIGPHHPCCDDAIKDQNPCCQAPVRDSSRYNKAFRESDGQYSGGKLQLPVVNGTEREARQFHELLTDGLSIVEIYNIEKEDKWKLTFQHHDTIVENSICNSTRSSTTYANVQEGIRKVLNFYESHKDLTSTKVVGRMTFLKGVDDKFGKRFQSEYPIADWITKICSRKDEFCSNNWKQRAGSTWKSADVLNSIDSSWELVGHEKEYLWGKLSGQCQKALVKRCAVPHICERTLYDPIPRSQFYLSHQVLQRILTEQSNCPDTKRLLSEEVNDRLCSKMYQEAQLVSQMGYPHSLRDIFLEYVAFCGYMRYPNFFREDWMESILSWQSRSDYGCFTHGKDYKRKFWTGDKTVRRRSTFEEKEKGIASDEECLPHLTTVGLAALAMSWEFMEDNCKGILT